MWNGSSWITRNFSGYYDTIFLFKSDGISPAHLDLGNLTAQGAINFYDDNVRFYRDANNLRVQTPGGAGLIVEQNLWCNALAVNTSAGITGALSASSISSSGVIHGGGGSGDAFKVGDDIYIVDVDNANRLSLQGAQSRTQAGIQFGSGGMWLYRDSAYLRCSSGFVADGTVAVGTYASGGTGSAVYFNSSHQLYQGTSLMVYKTNIETLDDASWIYSLRPVTFDWKDDKDAQLFGRQIGLVAEEVQPIAPLLTFNDVQTGKLQGVIYEKLAVPMLVELQKLRHEVDELKTKLAA